MSVSISREQEITIVALGAELAQLHEGPLEKISEQFCAAVENATPPLVVVDLSQVEFFGSSFLELLFKLWHKMTAKGGKFVLCGAHGHCEEVLVVTNLDKLWQNYPTRSAAVAALQMQA